VAKERKKVFAAEYLANGQNATQAAIAAGYSRRTAGAAGHRVLKDAEIRAQIEAAAQQAAEKAGLTLDRTLREVARVAYADPRRLYDEDGALKPIADLDDETAAVIASVEVEEIGVDGAVIGRVRKIRTWDKNAALEKAMKFHGAYEADNRQKPPATVSIGQLSVALDFDAVASRARAAGKK
jgi:phage terminase small subunit